MPTYDEIMRSKGRILASGRGSGKGQGIPTPIVMATVKCPNCDQAFQVRLRIAGFNVAVDYPMSKKDLAKQQRRAA